MKLIAWLTVLAVLAPISPVWADEKVDASIASLRAQIKGTHERIMIVIPALNKAWDDFKEDPSPANEARINKLSGDLKILENLRNDLWKWLSVMKTQESMTINTLRQILNESESALDSAAQWARGVVPGATWILGVSKETLYNERWKDTEAAFTALSSKGAELRKRYKAILSDIQNKVSDTPENREELANLEKEIAIWKAKMETVSEIYEFLRSDMPGEVIFWHELTGPYVKAFEENIKKNLEEILLWDTLGGTSPAERLYKLFKPVIQMKVGELFNDPVLTDKVRNVIVMEVLFANAPLDRMIKSAETGVGKVLNSAGLQKAASELLGNRTRRQELQAMLQQMSYDRIPGGAGKYLGGATPKPSGPIANFTVSGLKADEVKRLQKVKNSKAVADGIMKVATELVGPLLNSGAFRTALETAKQECATYRKVYRQLRAAKIVGMGTYVGIKGQAATSAEDNFVNECFENPDVFADYLEKLKGERKGIDVAQYSIKKTYREKKVEVENDVFGDPEFIESTGYEENTQRLQEIWNMLSSNQIAASQVGPEVENSKEGLFKTYSNKYNDIRKRFMSLYNGEPEERCIQSYRGNGEHASGCPRDFTDTIKNEWKSYCMCAKTFDEPFRNTYDQDVPVFVGKYTDLKDQATFPAKLMVQGKETCIELIESQDVNYSVDIFKGPDAINDTLWWNRSSRTFYEEISRIEGVADAPGIPLKGCSQVLQTWIDTLDETIKVLEKFLLAKQDEKTRILSLCPLIEDVADILGEHRNFYQYAQGEYSNLPVMLEGGLEVIRAIDVDVDIRLLSGFEERFTLIFDQRYTAFEKLIERLEDRRKSVENLAYVYDSSNSQIWQLFGTYHDLFEEVYDGYSIVNDLKVDTIVALFEKGISIDQQGSIYIESLCEELSSATLNDVQIDFIINKGHDTFVQAGNITPIAHPVLRSFVTPSLKRIEKARSILWFNYADQDQLMQGYRQKQAMLEDVENQLSRLLRKLRNSSRTAAPDLASMANIESLQHTQKMKNYDVWPDMPDVNGFITIPDVLIKELNTQERALIRYHTLVDGIIQETPLSAEQAKAVAQLEELARQVDELGPGWLSLPAAQFTKKINEINAEAYNIYGPIAQAGKAPPKGPVNIAYGEVLRKVNLLTDKVYGNSECAEIIDTLQAHISDVEDFLENFSTAGADPFPWISMLEDDIKPGSKADTFKDNKSVAGLIRKTNMLIEQLRGFVTMPQPDTSHDEDIREFYRAFKDAYESKDESLVMSFLSDEWEAGDGTTLEDLEDNLYNSFSVFDEIRYEISNMTLAHTPGGTYSVSYDVTITGRIYEMNMKHEEKSNVNEEIFIENDKIKVIRTMGGRFWYVE